MAKSELSHSFVLSILDYNKDTGVFVWRKRTPEMFKDGYRSKEGNCNRWNKQFAGKIAGCERKDKNRKDFGRKTISINDTLYYANVIAWFYVYEEWPTVDVDHIDRDASNDAINNLRLATNSQNRSNQTKNKNNSTGYKGVSFSNRAKRFTASITKDSKKNHLGYFDSAEEAHAAYCEAARELFGEFACFD